MLMLRKSRQPYIPHDNQDEYFLHGLHFNIYFNSGRDSTFSILPESIKKTGALPAMVIHPCRKIICGNSRTEEITAVLLKAARLPGVGPSGMLLWMPALWCNKIWRA